MEGSSQPARRLSFDAELDSTLSNDASIVKPVVGMEFQSENHAYCVYNSYAGSIGFGIRRDWVNRTKDKKIILSRRYTCSKEGHRRNENSMGSRKDTRTGCPSFMTIARQSNNKYSVTHFNDSHNHPLVSPSKRHLIRSQRKVSEAQGTEAILAANSGIKPKETYEFMSQQVGGRENLGFLRSDLKNYLFRKRQKDMQIGEAGSLHYYFQKKQSENPDFRYSVQLDIDDQIANIFWTDAKMRADYEQYGDVVCFDTTFRTNKENRPFAPFVGVNNHKETVVFGAALLYDETISSFEWIFEAFLEAMSGKKPKTILTDQDAAMARAIPSVFSGTYHRICVWHLHQNALKHLSHVFKSYKSFSKDFQKCIYDYEDEEYFLQAWNDMLRTYHLEKNSWLEGIFKERKKWALVYGRHTFCADMKSTQLSESFNSTLKKYLNCKLDVQQFFIHFERVLDDVRHKELNSNHDMTQKIPRLRVDSVLLRQARDVFTSKVFDWFQIEFEKSMNLVVNRMQENGLDIIYHIGVYGKSLEHVVTYDTLNGMFSCSCLKFEFVGILCSHVLKVFDRRDVKLIPAKYIMTRWSKNGTVKIIKPREIRSEIEDQSLSKLVWYKDLCRESIHVSGMAVGSKEDYEYFLSLLHETKLKFLSNKTNTTVVQEDATVRLTHLDNEDSVNITRAKGLKKKEGGIKGGSRLKSGLELNSKKKKRKTSKPQETPTQVAAPQTLQGGVENSLVTTNYQVPNFVFGQNNSEYFHQARSVYINAPVFQASTQENQSLPTHLQLLQGINNSAQLDGKSEGPYNFK